MTSEDLEIFVTAPPGLEHRLRREMLDKGFSGPDRTAGGVTTRGGWPEVWRANLELRGAGRVLVRIAEFRAFHLAQLDKRARQVDWASVLRQGVPVRVEVATDRRSKIYHGRAAAERIGTALKDAGVPVAADGPVTLKVRIDDNLVTISVDTSGESLHKRGHKAAVGKAPMRETLAALFLAECGYRGEEPVLDPMCGSGTFVIEAAEIAAGLQPGRGRAFAFEQLATYDPAAVTALRRTEIRPTDLRFHGSDRDAGAVQMAGDNARRAGVEAITTFERRAVSDLVRPDGPPGLVMVNPPYGARIGDRRPLFALYGALGKVLSERFSGWRVGLVTSDAGLASATALPFAATKITVPHGGLRITLHRTDPLP